MPNGQQFFGQHSGFIGDELRGTIESGGMTPVLERLLSQGRKDIGRRGRSAREQITESGAQSGFRGAGANLFNELFESEASQISSLETGIGQQASQQETQALQQLLGLTQFQGGQQLGGAQLTEGTRRFDLSFEENKRQFGLNYALEQERLKLQRESQEFNIGEFLGNLVGGAGEVGTAFAMGG